MRAYDCKRSIKKKRLNGSIECRTEKMRFKLSICTLSGDKRSHPHSPRIVAFPPCYSHFSFVFSVVTQTLMSHTLVVMSFAAPLTRCASDKNTTNENKLFFSFMKSTHFGIGSLLATAAAASSYPMTKGKRQQQQPQANCTATECWLYKCNQLEICIVDA